MVSNVKVNKRAVKYTIKKSEPIEEFKQDPMLFIRKMMKYEAPELYIYDQDVSNCVAITNELLCLSNRFGNNIYCTQDYIARKVKLCRATVNRWIKKLADWGLITKVYRSRGDHYLSSLYGISSYFLNETVRQSLKGIFYALSYMHISLITPSIQATNQYNSKNCYSRSFLGINKNNNLAIDSKIPSKNILEGNKISHEYGGTPLHPRRIVKVMRITSQDKLCEIYPHLSSNFAYAIAVLLNLTPAKSVWLSQIPIQILRDAYTQLFNDYKFGKKIEKESCYLAGIIHKMCKNQEIRINYNLIPAIIAMYALDSTWIKLLPEELSILSSKIRPLQDKFSCALKELDKKNPEVIQRREEAEKKRVEEAIKRGRTNPYSPYYTGDPFVNSSSLSNSLYNKPNISHTEPSLSIPPKNSADTPHGTKETIIVNNPSPLGAEPTPQEECKKIINDRRIALSKMPGFMYTMMKNNWTDELKFKFPFLPADFDILTYQI